MFAESAVVRLVNYESRLFCPCLTLLVDTFLGCARGVVLVLCPFCAFCCAVCMCLCDALLCCVHVVGGGGSVSCLCPCV